jgi:hypothetical protein
MNIFYFLLPFVLGVVVGHFCVDRLLDWWFWMRDE